MPAFRGGMILYSCRSAKSVACSRLNVIGVRAFFFLPALVAAFTSADEFHSVTNTRCPLAVSHFDSRLNCVVFPEPSMPSTTNRRPGRVWGEASVSSMRRRVLCGRGRAVPGDLTAYLALQLFGEGGRVAFGGPELELGVVRRGQAEGDPPPGPTHAQASHHLRMAPVEGLGEPHNAAKQTNRPPPGFRQRFVAFVGGLRCRLAMVPRHETDNRDLIRFEAAQAAVFDEVVRVLVVPLVADVRTDVVDERTVFEPLALLLAEAMARLQSIEDGERQAGDLLR